MKTAKHRKMSTVRAASRKKRIASRQKNPRPRKKQIPPVTKTKFRRALVESGGRKTVIAQRLDCSLQVVYNRLKDPKWADVAEAYREEQERIKDDAENTIYDIMRQKLDLGQARQAAQFVLSRMAKDRGWGDEKTVRVEGGDEPIKHEHSQVPIEALDLPVEVRAAILEALEDMEERQRVLDVASEVAP